MTTHKKSDVSRTPAQARAFQELLKSLSEYTFRLPRKRVKALRARGEISRKLTKELLA